MEISPPNPPSLHPSLSAVPPEKPTLLVSGKKQGWEGAQAIPGPKKWPSRAGAVVREIG